MCPFETKKQLADGLRRRHYSALDVLYFIRGKKGNLTRIVDDYRQEVVETPPDLLERIFPCILRGLPDIEVEPAMYADCRVLIIPGEQQRPSVLNWQLAHDWILNQVENRGKELLRLQNAYKADADVRECLVEVMAYESSMFSLDLPDTLSIVYTHALSANTLEGREADELRDSVFDHLDTVAHRLMSALVTANEYPYIRYTKSNRGIAETVARSLGRQLKQFREMHPSFTPWGDSKAYEDPATGQRRLGPPEAATVIVVDRVDDLTPAVLHDVTYQALVTDLLDHEPATPFTYSYTKGGVRVEKDVLLDETDPVWRQLRNEEMGTVMETVDDAVRAANARADARKRLNPNDVSDLRELMSTLAGDEKLVDEKFAQHYRMKNQIIERYERKNLQDVITLEQVYATGCDAEGNHVNSKKTEALLRELLRDDRLE